VCQRVSKDSHSSAQQGQKTIVAICAAARVFGNLCTARGDWALDPEDLSQTTESQSRP